MPHELIVASYDTPTAYYEGGHYELNLSFATLRDKQWQRVMEALWQHPSLYGPLAERYTPGGNLSEPLGVQAPPPTATLTQHGQIKVGEAVMGVDVQATRSLFECISILVPIGMFEGLTPGLNMRQQYPQLQALDDLFCNIALAIYDTSPFKIAAIGYERGCQLPVELNGDAEIRNTFLSTGNFMAQDDVIKAIDTDLSRLSRYEQVRGNLRWLPPMDIQSPNG